MATTALLGTVGAVLRYVLRLSVSIERAAEIARETAAALHHHTAASELAHKELTEQTAGHATRLAVLESGR